MADQHSTNGAGERHGMGVSSTTPRRHSVAPAGGGPRLDGRASADVDSHLERARAGLVEAATVSDPRARYAAAHVAGLRAAAAMLAARAKPTSFGRRGGPRSVWALLVEIAPELREWAAFFAAGAGKRAAAEAGIVAAVAERDADDLLRDAATFLALVETTLGRAHQPALPSFVVALRAG